MDYPKWILVENPPGKSTYDFWEATFSKIHFGFHGFAVPGIKFHGKTHISFYQNPTGKFIDFDLFYSELWDAPVACTAYSKAPVINTGYHYS